MATKRFNVRVYGIIRHEQSVLVSDELRFGNAFTKFPGGGLEWGEGMKECLDREIEEELGIEADVKELFYATDFFQQSAFKPDDQLLSFYFNVEVDPTKVPITDHPVPMIEEGEAFRWVKIEGITPEMFTFPIDKHVAGLLMKSI